MNRFVIPLAGHFRIVTIVIVVSLPRLAMAEEVSAFTEPYRDIDVAAPEMGTLAELQVKEGDRVTTGQLLGRLDDDVLQASLKMAETGMNSRGKLNSVLAELRLQAERLQKLIALRNRQHASQQEVDRTEAQKQIAEANLEAVQDELKIKSFERQRIEAELRRRHFISPIDGVVTKIYKDIGEFVSASDPTIVKVVQLDPLLILLPAPINSAQNLAVDSSVSLIIGDEPEPVEGTVEFISPTADAQSGTVRVRIRVPNPDGRIPCGVACNLVLSDSSPDSKPRREVAHLSAP